MIALRWGFLHWAEVLVGILLLAVIATQLVIPAWRGQRMWPLFRRQWKLERGIAGVEQERREAELAAELGKATETKTNPSTKTNKG